MEDTNVDREMPLTAAVRLFMEQQGWEDDLAINEARTASSLATKLLINEQKYKCHIEVTEDDQRIFVYLYTPFNVPRARLDIVSRLFNRLHAKLYFGRLICKEGNKPRPIQFKVGLTVKDSTLSPAMVDALVGFAVSTFRVHEELVAGAALSRRSLEELWAEHLAAEQESSEWPRVKVPRLLN